ncbi:MAG TPA: O-acetyl-ADP-ribose deacetylase [Terriglobales bacterium]|nr:O-acetyl-ADP-ribose deacetylase [Terriglobales bacterium]
MSDFSAKLTFPDGKILELLGPDDITKETTDAIVNAANSSLLGGGGVDGAIHRAGGPAILEECERIVAKIKYLPEGKAVITTGGRLAARHVIHTVGPIYQVGNRDEAEALASCHSESIRVADEHGLSSLAFPAISTGAYGYPLDEAAEIAIRTVAEMLPSCAHLRNVRFVLFAAPSCKAFIRAAEAYSRRNTSVIFEKSS